MKKHFSDKKSLMRFLLLTCAMCVLMGISVLAAEPAPYDITSAITTGMENLQSNVYAIIAIVMPIVIAIVGTKIALKYGVRLFKGFTSM